MIIRLGVLILKFCNLEEAYSFPVFTITFLSFMEQRESRSDWKHDAR